MKKIAILFVICFLAITVVNVRGVDNGIIAEHEKPMNGLMKFSKPSNGLIVLLEKPTNGLIIMY